MHTPWFFFKYSFKVHQKWLSKWERKSSQWWWLSRMAKTSPTPWRLPPAPMSARSASERRQRLLLWMAGSLRWFKRVRLILLLSSLSTYIFICTQNNLISSFLINKRGLWRKQFENNYPRQWFLWFWTVHGQRGEWEADCWEWQVHLCQRDPRGRNGWCQWLWLFLFKGEGIQCQPCFLTASAFSFFQTITAGASTFISRSKRVWSTPGTKWITLRPSQLQTGAIWK